jgi:SAM-dependent methyltransferase
VNPSAYWRANADLQHITPPGERFPEVGLFEALGRACHGSVFEFGCGDGRLSPVFDPHKYVGFDINPAALDAARRANPAYRYTDEWEPAETFLAHTVLLHVDDTAIVDVIVRARTDYRRIVIGEIMGRQWRRGGDPPVFNRDVVDYARMVERLPEIIEVPYPRYRCNLQMLIFDNA